MQRPVHHLSLLLPLLGSAVFALATLAPGAATATSVAPAPAQAPAWRIEPPLQGAPRVGLAMAMSAPAAPAVSDPSKAPQLVLTDPTGDNFNPAADATTIQAEILSGNITFTLGFAVLSVANVYGSLNLDLDKNPSTGQSPPANGSASQDVGVERELYMDIWNANAQPQPLVLVLDGPTRAVLFSHPMTIVGTTVSFTIPLTELANDDGNMNLAMGVINGTQSLFADLSPDTGHGTVNASADVTRPTVLSVAPTNAATGVVRDTQVIVTFSEPLAPATVNSTNFNLKQGATPIAGSISLSGGNTVATFTPSALLTASTVYTVTATTGITDVATNPLNGNGSGGNFTSTFTTGTGVSLPLLASDPSGDATGPHDLTALRVGETVTTFTFGLDLASFNAADAYASINLDIDRNPSTGQHPPLSGSPTSDIGAEYELWLDLKNLNARPQPTAFLLNAATRAFLGPEYPMTLTPTTVRFSVPVSQVGEQQDGSFDLAMIIWSPSNGQASDFLPGGSGHVTFVTAIDRVPPAVLTVSPANGTQGVAVGANTVLTFDGAVDPTTVTGASIFLRNTKTATNVAASLTLSAGNTVVTIDPTAAMADSVRHEVHVTTTLKDVAGNAMTAEFVSDFRTADITRPTVTFALPANGQTGLPASTTMLLNFSEIVSGVDRDKFKLLAGTQRIAASYSLINGGKAALLTPLLPLTGSTTYTVRGETTILDLNGNALNGNGSGGPWVSTFTTAASAPPDTLKAPTVTVPAYWTQVTVPIYLRNSFAVGGVTFTLTYNAAELALHGVSSAPRSAGMEYIAANSPSAGTAVVTMLSNLAGSSGSLVAAGGGTVVNVVLDVIAAEHAATIPLTITAGSLSVQSGLAFANPARVAGSVVRDPALAGPPVGLTRFELGQPAPNPFNPRVTFAVSMPAAGHARVAVHDARGALVRVLWNAELPAGTRQLIWDGTDAQGAPAASGVYFFRLDAAAGSRVRKAVLAR